MSKEYTIEVSRTGFYRPMSFVVVAKSEREAKRLALDKAHNQVFSEYDAVYSTQVLNAKNKIKLNMAVKK